MTKTKKETAIKYKKPIEDAVVVQPEVQPKETDELFLLELSLYDRYMESKKNSTYPLPNKQHLKTLDLTPAMITKVIATNSQRHPSEEFPMYKNRMKIKSLISNHRNFLVYA